MTRTGLVIVASTRAAAGEYTDRSGPIAVSFLRELGFTTPDALVVPDADMPATIDRILTGERPDVVLTSGGTGVTPDDRTVDAVTPHLDSELPGIVHAFFARGMEHTPTAVVSRAVAGIVGHTFVMTLPGSTGGVRDGCEVLQPLLTHLLDQLAGARTGHDHAADRAPADPAYVADQTGVDERDPHRGLEVVDRRRILDHTALPEKPGDGRVDGPDDRIPRGAVSRQPERCDRQPEQRRGRSLQSHGP